MIVDPLGIDEELRSDVDVTPGEIVDAGPDPRRPHPVRHGLRLRREARRLFGTAILQNTNEPDLSSGTIRKAIHVAASATYWLEDTEELTNAHFHLHMMGSWAREFHEEDCLLHWTGSQYEHRCPVHLAHWRFGVSPAMLVRSKICSLCGEPKADCAHLPNHLYRIRGGSEHSPTGRCPICIQKTCNHSPDQTYLAWPVGIVTEIVKVEEVSFASRPASPDARMLAVPVSLAGLAERLGPTFTPGVTLHCHQCRLACPGFTYLPEEP